METDRIPVYLADITFYQREAGEMSEAEAALSCEWREILKNCSSADELQDYKDSVKAKLQILNQFAEQICRLEAEGTLQSCLQEAKKAA